jgi:hypothetical protein
MPLCNNSAIPGPGKYNLPSHGAGHTVTIPKAKKTGSMNLYTDPSPVLLYKFIGDYRDQENI